MRGRAGTEAYLGEVWGEYAFTSRTKNPIYLCDLMLGLPSLHSETICLWVAILDFCRLIHGKDISTTHTHTPSPGDSSGTAKHDVFWQCEKQGCYPSGTVLPDSNELKCKAATTLRRSQHLHLVKLRKEMDGQEEAMWWLAMFQVGRTDDIK